MNHSTIETSLIDLLKDVIPGSKLKELQSLQLNPYQDLNDNALTTEVWNIYSRVLHSVVGKAIQPHQDVAYASPGFKILRVPDYLMQPLVDATSKGRETFIHHEDYAPGYTHHVDLRPYEERMNRDHRWIKFGYRQKKAIEPVLAWLADPFECFSGLPWRVANLRCWRTPPGATEVGPNDWHLDGFPLSSFKIMLYLTPVGAELGTTQVKTADGNIHNVEGPPGTTLIFRNSELYHRGLAPLQGERTILEITTVPCWRTDTTPVSAGLNAQIPSVPWHYLT